MSKPDPDALNVDLLVVGGGMAGMTAAAFAAEQGYIVLVVEKATAIGGSAIISGGGFWTAADFETLRAINPLGESDQARTLIDTYDEAGAFIASLGVGVTPKEPYLGTQSFPGWVRHVDMPQYMAVARRSIEAAGGFVVVDATVDRLTMEKETVTGAVVESVDGSVSVVARATILATGGFQNDEALRIRHIGAHAAGLLLRSNPHSDGQGLRLGLDVGAATSRHMDGFYGHTMPFPIARPLAQQDFLPFAQFYLSPRGILLDRNGGRFVDESAGYYLNAQAVAKLPDGRGLLVFDRALRDEDSERYGVDRFDFARRRGAHVAQAETWDELGELVRPWGYGGVATGLASYHHSLDDEARSSPPRSGNRRRHEAAPFFAMEVQSAITFTHGGLRIDGQARVLDGNGRPIAGLFAAGADAGGTYQRGYAGGLAMAATFGIVAARTALGPQQG